MDISELIIGAFTTSPSPLPDSPILPKMPARLITLELRDEYRRTGRCVRCGSKDHWIKNCSLDPYIALAGTGKQVTVIGIDNDDYEDSSSGFDNGSYDRTRSELEAEVDRIVTD
ncbi:hypothetical protein NA56DRAFT_698138 [Hyaloscypha hepaticicola]|uniref:CCHC-type domain-containing protein n=1 Tax=Hyaloscypha hepaticicola TaxID=2082293 RepID=A0A2J6QKV4_9HELO|nr:hypothetical protein NA56DRAFT_698138 [Hyaloscypha hepaticicola]